MRTPRLLMAAASVALLAATTAPVVAATPAPSPETPGCRGQIVATLNHVSGAAGPSGNPNASTGPGYSLRQETAAAISEARALCA